MFFRRRSPARLGTPENPEIIEPGQNPRRRPVGGGRWHQALQILTWGILVAAPAFFFDSVFVWLIELARQDENPLVWLLTVLVAPLALVATLVALLALSVLTLFFIANLFGRSTIKLARF